MVGRTVVQEAPEAAAQPQVFCKILVAAGVFQDTCWYKENYKHDLAGKPHLCLSSICPPTARIASASPHHFATRCLPVYLLASLLPCLDLFVPVLLVILLDLDVVLVTSTPVTVPLSECSLTAPAHFGAACPASTVAEFSLCMHDVQPLLCSVCNLFSAFL